MPDFNLPDVGEGLTEAEIVSWKVRVGDVIAVNDVIVEIETAKSLVELPSPYAGTVLDLRVAEGETVAVGTPIITVGDPAAAAAPAASPSEAEIDLSNPAATGGGEGESLVGRNKADRSAVRRARTEQPVSEFVPTSTPGKRSRVRAKPPVRKLARDLGVDLTEVASSGPDGTVSRADVEDAAGSPVPAAAGPRETRQPIKGVRKVMGQAMVDSAFSIPHVTEWVSLDVTRTVEFVERLKEHPDFRGVKVSPLLVLARAAMLAMRRTPQVNSYWDEDAQEIVVKHYVNLGIAAATPRGLVVPHIPDAQDLSLRDLAVALNDLTATARQGRTQPGQMIGGTFTISNIGVFGIDGGTPIINPGEAAILCFGAIRKQPWVVSGAAGDELAIRQVTTLSLSFDHRHIDGQQGSQFLADVTSILTDPAAALLF